MMMMMMKEKAEIKPRSKVSSLFDDEASDEDEDNDDREEEDEAKGKDGIYKEMKGFIVSENRNKTSKKKKQKMTLLQIR